MSDIFEAFGGQFPWYQNPFLPRIHSRSPSNLVGECLTFGFNWTFCPGHMFFYDINFHLFVNQSPFRHQLIDPMDCWESPVEKRQNDNFRLFRPNRAPGLIGLKTVSNRNSPLDWSWNDGFTPERWEWMKNDKPERSVNRPICHQSVNPTFSVRVWKTPIRSGNLEKRGWKLTKWPSRLQKWP